MPWRLCALLGVMQGVWSWSHEHRDDGLQAGGLKLQTPLMKAGCCAKSTV